MLAMALLIGSYPDGVVERAWQRLALRCLLDRSPRPAAGSACITRRAGVSTGSRTASLSLTRMR